LGEPSETAEGRETRHGPVDGSLRLTLREKAAFLARLLREGEPLGFFGSVSNKDSSVSRKTLELSQCF